ncbi:type II toxin-antitoxin system VapC family toxin [Arthrobacter sp. NPDC089319]|uniref:type II toxin-antitoxin system VapC family toxin n=1 Tax=Arthrobacter sp. NPDC089319 TaxID=3155915 RepID=UPI003412DEE0
MTIYLDTSAVLKLVIDGAESTELAGTLTRFSADGGILTASMLLYTELHCAARRRVGAAVAARTINAVLAGINLVDLSREDLMFAAALPGRLRSADAIHLATAIRLRADTFVAYGVELIAAAEDAGLSVLSPGRADSQGDLR